MIGEDGHRFFQILILEPGFLSASLAPPAWRAGTAVYLSELPSQEIPLPLAASTEPPQLLFKCQC